MITHCALVGCDRPLPERLLGVEAYCCLDHKREQRRRVDEDEVVELSIYGKARHRRVRQPQPEPAAVRRAKERATALYGRSG